MKTPIQELQEKLDKIQSNKERDFQKDIEQLEIAMEEKEIAHKNALGGKEAELNIAREQIV